MKNNLVWFIVIVGALFFIANTDKIPYNYEKAYCEQSGGTWERRFSETAGFTYGCDCPEDKYEKDKRCYTITNSEVNLCRGISNEYVDCDDNLGACECIFKNSGTKSYLPYAQLLSMTCSCSADACGCVGW